MVSHDIVHVAIAPPDTLDANLVRDVAGIIGKGAYDTRILLAGQLPKTIAHYENMETAQSISQSLIDLGLVTFVCKDSELHSPAQCFRAHTLQFKEAGVLFCDRGGQTRMLESSNVILLLSGKIRSYVETKTTKTEVKLGHSYFPIFGRIPTWRITKEKTTDTTLQSERFARIYDRESSNASVEIIGNGMDYSFLGESMAFSAFANFSAVVTKLREAFPQAIFDDRLMKPFAAGDIETSCKLIYLYHLAIGRNNGRV